MVEYINTNAKAIYIRWCDGPERHRMLTVINAYYSYYEILQVVRFCTNLALMCKCKAQSSTFSTGNPLIQM